MKSIIIWDMTPCSPLPLATCLLVGLLDFSSTLKMEAICSSETSVDTQRTTRRHIPEDDTLHNALNFYSRGSVSNVGLITSSSISGISFSMNSLDKCKDSSLKQYTVS
jgi:hypothetical protein